MPSITCPNCPTRLKVPDGTSGNVRCPKCGTVFPVAPVPAFEVVEEPAPKPKAPAPPPKRAAAKVEADEEPDFEVVDEKPKKRVKAVVEDDDEDDERPRKKKKSRDEDDEDEPRAKKKRRRDEDEDEDDEDYRPRKKKKRRSGGGGGVLAILGIALACLLLVAGLVWLLWPGGAANVRYLPDNSTVVASLKAEELLNSKAFKQIKDEFPMIEKDWETESEFGLSVNDISSVLVGGGKLDGKSDFVVVVQTNKSVKAEDMLAKAKNNKFTKETVGGYALYTRGTDAFCVAESKVVLLGTAESLRSVLKRDGKPKLSDGMRAAMKETDFSKTVAVAVDAKEFLPKGGGAGPNRGGMPFGQEANQYLKDVEGFAGWVSVGTNIDTKFTAIFKNAAAAADAKKLLDGALVVAKNGKNIPPDVLEMIEKTEFRQSGNRIEMSGSIEVSKLLKAVKSAGGKF